jgi:DNA replication protein DnaC
VAYQSNGHTDGALRHTAEWIAASRYRSLLLMGGVGTGKTVLLRALHLFFRRYFPDKILGCGDEVMGSYLFTATKVAKLDEYEWRIATTADVLLIDDVGVEPVMVKTYGTESTPLVELLCDRYERQYPTILSTNLDMEELRGRYGERLYDRLCETYAKLALVFKSFRQP